MYIITIYNLTGTQKDYIRCKKSSEAFNIINILKRVAKCENRICLKKVGEIDGN